MSNMNDVDPFTPIQSLLNYKFESYHLSQSPPPSASFILPNSSGATPIPYKNNLLSFAEAHSRAHHNHLASGHDRDLLYIDSDLLVTLVTFNQQSFQPSFHSLLTLPAPPLSSSVIAEYPTAISLSPSSWLISDGHGSLHHILVSKQSPDSWTATLNGTYALESSLPFRLHSATLTSDQDLIKALLSTTVKSKPKLVEDLPKVPGPGGGGGGGILRPKIESATAFDWISVSLAVSTLPGGSGVGEPILVKAEWTVRSADLPHFASILSATPEATSYLVGSSTSPTTGPSLEKPVQSSLPTTSSAISSSSTSTPPLVQKTPPPPYSWTQDRESLTLVFAVPSTIPTSSIRVVFSKHFLTLHLASATSALSHPNLNPHVSHKKLWDAIDPHSSVWTFDRDAEGRDSSFGLLSLHLEKSNYGTRWTSVFSQTPDEGEGEGGKEFEDVPETLDPSELINIVESMEKYTTDEDIEHTAQGIEHDGMGDGGLGSLKGDEMDLEIDSEGGSPLVVSLLLGKPSLNGDDMDSAEDEDEIVIKDGGGAVEVIKSLHPGFKHSLLSTPLSFSSQPKPSSLPNLSILIKHDVDGLVFLPPATPPSTTWTHISTFPAVAFVLATKRNSTFIHHFLSPTSRTESVVFALTSSATATGGPGNLFAYFMPEEEKSKIGVQKVVSIGQAGSGALLGVAGIEVGGKKLVVVLMEKELGVYSIWD